jgi:protein arginine kinase
MTQFVDHLIGQLGEWLKSSGAESDIVISSRLRLARNLADYPFNSRASAQTRKEVEVLLKDVLTGNGIARALTYVSLGHAPLLDRQVLLERHLISKEHAAVDKSLGTGVVERGVAVSRQETLAIMVNEEDHLRVQVLRSGFQFEEAWKELGAVDDALARNLKFAFSSQFGYLTCCPTNVGTGLRVSVMLHLPALVITKQLDKVFEALSRINFNVRGFFGEGSQAMGDFYQISNQVTLGKSEEEMIEEMNKVIPQIIDFERTCRQKLLEGNRERLEDSVWRSYGILTTARYITTEETMERLSALRLGVHLDLLSDVPIKTINELFICTQPGHLQKIEGRALEAEERDAVRAALIRRKLGGTS